MNSTYLKLFVDCLEKYRKLNDTEFGRLIRAALHYKANGGEVKLTGREELLWDGFKLDIDRDNRKYEEISLINSENGKKGGRPRNQTKADESEKSQDKDKDKEKEKDIKENNTKEKVIEVVEYLNAKAGKNFSTKSKHEHISARLNDGRTVDNLKYVIDVKCEEWLDNAEMEKYLNPETLFRPTKFDTYLNQKMKNPAVPQTPKFEEV